MPIFLIFTVFLATIIRISVVDMALNQAVSETTEIVATHVYPAQLLYEAGRGKADELIKNSSDDHLDLGKVSELTEQLFDVLGIDLDNYLGSVAAQAMSGFVSDKFDEANPDSVVGGGQIEIVEVNSPLGFNSNDPYLEVVVTYDVPIQAPFIDTTLTLEKRGYERLWIGK